MPHRCTIPALSWSYELRDGECGKAVCEYVLGRERAPSGIRFAIDDA
jgi:hypothetical protein